MREILFRGKTFSGEWVEGAYFKHVKRQISPIGDELRDEDVVHMIVRSGFADWNMPRQIEGVEVDPATVGQFTGLLDKNGSKVFEGDIVVSTHERRLSNAPKPVEWTLRGYVYAYPDRMPVIVGNIHEPRGENDG